MEWTHGSTSGQVVAGGNAARNDLDQLKNPTDVIVDRKSTSLFICDKGNRTVVQWCRRNGTSGRRILSNIDCFGLMMTDDEFLYVTGIENHEEKHEIDEMVEDVCDKDNQS